MTLAMATSSLYANSLESYLQYVNNQPRLSAEEEVELAKRVEHDNDIEAVQSLILSHLRFVANIAFQYRNYGMQIQDLIQEGNIGLMKAIKGYDYRTGFRLSTYSVHWIKSEIHEFIIKNFRSVKIATTKAQRKLFFNLRKMRKGQGLSMTENEAQIIADELNVPLYEVRTMELRMQNSVASLDAPVQNDDRENTTFVDLLECDNKSITLNIDAEEEEHQKSVFLSALDTLDERSQDIITSRYLSENKTTLGELADKYQVSSERIRQIESKGIRSLKEICMAS